MERKIYMQPHIIANNKLIKIIVIIGFNKLFFNTSFLAIKPCACLTPLIVNAITLKLVSNVLMKPKNNVIKNSSILKDLLISLREKSYNTNHNNR